MYPFVVARSQAAIACGREKYASPVTLSVNNKGGSRGGAITTKSSLWIALCEVAFKKKRPSYLVV